MQRYWWLLLLFIFLVTPVRAEEIKHFQSTVAIQPNGEIVVKEQILYDFGQTPRHGIFRYLPFVKTNNQGQKFKLDFQKFAVSLDDRANYAFSKSETSEQIDLKIGEASSTLLGEHSYEISYLVRGALADYSEHDELYWNLTGNGWQVPINLASVEVYLPGEYQAEQIRLKCFTGPKDSKEQNCSASETSAQHFTFQTTRPLAVGEGLTIVFGYPKGLITPLPAEPYVAFAETWYGKLLIALLAIGLTLLALFWYLLYPVWVVIKWFKYGRDPKGSIGVASAWFSAPKVDGKALTPAEIGTAVDEKAETKDIMAMVVDLARRGYFKIDERKKNDFYLLKVKEFVGDKSLLSFEKKFLTAVFETKNEVRVKDTKLYLAFGEITSQLYQRVVTLGLFAKNPNSTRNFYLAIASLSLFTGNLLLLFISLVFGLQVPRKTAKGVDVANAGKALKNFLVSQDKQLAFQAEKKLLFEKLLPFAVAFGVEKIWAERFKNMALPAPEWYSSYQNKPFTSTLFVNNLSHSLNSVKSSMVPTSTTSSQGFSSGFSGGGSSGGGGGGGGGGSW